MSPDATLRPPNGSDGHPALALFLISLVLRPSIVAVGPLANSITADLRVPDSVVGLLATLPILCMGLFASLGPATAQRVGPRFAMALLAGALVACALLRSSTSSAAAIVALTAGIGIATGAAGSLPSIVAKLHAGGSRAAQLSGAAAAGTVAGATLAGAAAVPLASVFGGWRPSLAILGAAGCLSIGAWLVLYRQAASYAARNRARLPWRSRAAWLLAVVFGLQAVVYWGASAWLPATYAARGWSPTTAGDLVGLLNLIALGGNLAVAVLSDRFGGRRTQVVASAVGILASALGFVLVPDQAVFWTMFLGFSLGAIFPLLLALTVDFAADPAGAGALAAFMLSVGYVIAAAGPLLLGVARDSTGGFAATFPLLTGTGVALVAAAIGLVRERHVRTLRLPSAG